MSAWANHPWAAAYDGALEHAQEWAAEQLAALGDTPPPEVSIGGAPAGGLAVQGTPTPAPAPSLLDQAGANLAALPGAAVAADDARWTNDDLGLGPADLAAGGIVLSGPLFAGAMAARRARAVELGRLAHFPDALERVGLALKAQGLPLTGSLTEAHDWLRAWVDDPDPTTGAGPAWVAALDALDELREDFDLAPANYAEEYAYARGWLRPTRTGRLVPVAGPTPLRATFDVAVAEAADEQRYQAWLADVAGFIRDEAEAIADDWQRVLDPAIAAIEADYRGELIAELAAARSLPIEVARAAVEPLTLAQLGALRQIVAAGQAVEVREGVGPGAAEAAARVRAALAALGVPHL